METPPNKVVQDYIFAMRKFGYIFDILELLTTACELYKSYPDMMDEEDDSVIMDMLSEIKTSCEEIINGASGGDQDFGPGHDEGNAIWIE